MKEMILRYCARIITINGNSMKRKTKALFQVKFLFLYKLFFMFIYQLIIIRISWNYLRYQKREI